MLTSGKFGKQDAFCWKGYTDDEINGFMHNSEMKIVFSEGSAKEVTIYTQFAHWPDGDLKPWFVPRGAIGSSWECVVI